MWSARARSVAQILGLQPGTGRQQTWAGPRLGSRWWRDRQVEVEGKAGSLQARVLTSSVVFLWLVWGPVHLSRPKASSAGTRSRPAKQGLLHAFSSKKAKVI